VCVCERERTRGRGDSVFASIFFKKKKYFKNYSSKLQTIFIVVLLTSRSLKLPPMLISLDELFLYFENKFHSNSVFSVFVH
jgi:hypothetical protein